MVQTNYSRAPDDSGEAEKKNRFNYVISQVLAAAIGTILTINISSMNSITTIVNGALKETRSDAKVNTTTELFTISDQQASFYATLLVVTNLFASILSGLHQDTFGRRNCLLVSTFPQILSWLILYFSTNAYWLYLHALTVGVGSAFCEHVVVTYVSEISSVEMRGRLFSVGKFGYGAGAFLTFLLGNFYHWRQLALGLLILPVILPFYLFWLPESPLWLLSKGQDEECRKSLRWLRGWTGNETIEAEYQSILSQLKKRKAECEENSKSTAGYMKLFTKPEFLAPFKLAMVLLLSSVLLSLRAARFYFINFLHTLGVKADKMRIMTLTGVSGITGCVLLVMTIHKFGKRALTLWTFSASAVCLLLFALYSILHTKYDFNAVWIIYVLSAVLHCLGGYTLGGMPWFIISEIFPQRYRGFCSGITGMFGHLMITCLTGTFLTLEKMMGSSNLLCLYCFIGIICLFYLYKYLPETENKSLHDIEEYFKKRNNRPLEQDVCNSVQVKLCPTEHSLSPTLKDDNIHETP